MRKLPFYNMMQPILWFMSRGEGGAGGYNRT